MTDHTPSGSISFTPHAQCQSCCTQLVNFGVTMAGINILGNINLHIHCGELTALIGPNGAGKTTLFRAILGEIRHTGTLRFVHSGSQEPVSPKIGYVPQKLDFDIHSPISVLDLFASTVSKRPAFLGYSSSLRKTATQILSVVRADHLIHRRLGALSGGELQRVLLALALCPVPDILLLDEPISGIDVQGTALFYQIASELRRRYDLSIILVSHDIPAVSRFADRIVVLNRGVILDGRPADVIKDEKVIQTLGLSLPEGESS